MSSLSKQDVDTLFDEHLAKFPQLSEKINELRTLFATKMWHELTDILLIYVRDDSFDKGGNGNELIHFYEKMIEKLHDRINPLKYALISIACSRQFESIEDSIKFLEKTKDRLRNKRDALFLLEISKADKQLALGLHHDCFDLLQTVRDKIEESSDVDPKVFSALAQVYGLYYRRKDDHENYYKSSLSYLAYTDSSELDLKAKKDLSIKMGMSILLGKKVFNITELLDKDVINSLIGTEFEWLYHVLKALGHGQIDSFNQVVQQSSEQIQKFPQILKEITFLEQKVRIIAFLELVFQLGKDEISIPFTRISDVCQIELCDVELMMMKAMSFGLIRGTIDEVDKVVHVEWSQPRYLSKSHLEIMHRKMCDWETKMDSIIRHVENNAIELAKS